VNLLVSMAGIVIAGTVALIVAYLHRKQMRQIEAHRDNPAIPLKPPPSPVWRWLGKYANFLLMLLPIFDLSRHAYQKQPVTVSLVIDIALQVGMILYLIILYTFERVVDIIARNADLIHEVSKVVIELRSPAPPD
jgi:hypothetical protein